MADQEQFVSKFSLNQRRIFGFVVSISPCWAESDEIFQRVSLVLWQKWDHYDSQREFLPWALGVARLEVVKFMSEKSRRKEIFADDVLEALQARASEKSEESLERMTALQGCLKKLPDESRTLVLQCYSGESKMKDIAAATRTNAQSLYSKLQRIRKILHECVDKTLAAQESNL